ncbi:MAG TPA: ubiquinone/menaquinone biosynthesis methyltransferase, partial [Planctomycetota bacterium]|nr:ubiquinone/menaquinone biosynthesis methyltransferase [Planctomycetota bacterium]
MDKRAEAIRSMFDRISPTYDLLNHVFSLNANVRWRRRAAAEIPRAARVLDLCCGTGDFAFQAAVDGRRIFGLDFSAEMLRRARSKRRGRRVSLLQGDALRLPFRDGSFDACTVGWGVRNFADTRQGLAEIRRALRPGARLVILEFARPRTPLLKALYETYMKRVMRAVGDAVSRSRAYGYLSASVEGWHDAAGFVRLLGDCGFADP